ncbi:MAG: response regulator [Acetobacteraceae bacterium]
MLVEDDPLVRAAILRLLLASGLSAISVGDGEAAKMAMDEVGDFNLLVTDIRIPGRFDGLAVATEWRRQHPDCPIVFVSGHFDGSFLANALGPRDIFLRKPFRRAEFLEAIRCLFPSSEQIIAL